MYRSELFQFIPAVKSESQLNGVKQIRTVTMTSSIKADRPRRFNRETKPTFIIKPRRQFVDEGGTAKFKATFDGEPPPTLTWERKGQKIEEGGKFRLTSKNDFYFLEIDDVAEEDKGPYTCIISNSQGSEKVTADLEVYVKPKPASLRKRDPPKLEEGLKDVTVTDGDPLTLQCTITGDPEPSISWYHSGKLIKTTEDIKQVYNGRIAKLVFGEVFPEDHGTYECKATNANGEVKTSARIVVKEAKPPDVAPTFTTELVDQTIMDGEKVTFQCKVSGTPTPEVAWLKGTKQVKAGTDFKMSYDGTTARLDIVEVFPEDDGEYFCLAKNSAGEARSKCKLTVKEESPPPPPPTTPPKPTPVATPPKPTPTAPPPTADKPKNTQRSTATLNLTLAPPSSSNKQKQGPKFTRRLNNQDVLDGSRVEMLVEVEGTDPIDICWLFNGKEIKEDSQVYQRKSQGKIHRLIIAEVFPEDAGVYTCEAYNDHGDDDCKCTLSVKDRPVKTSEIKNGHIVSSNHDNELDEEDEEEFPPEFLKKPKSQNVDEGNPARFFCQIVANPPPKVRWIKDGTVIANGGRFKLSRDGEMYVFEITHTLATDEGRYLVEATNAEGTEQHSVGLTVKELENSDVSDFRSLLKSRPQLGGMGRANNTNVTPDKEAEQIDFRGVLVRHVKTKTGVLDDSPETLEIPQLKSVVTQGEDQTEREAEQIDFRNVLHRHVRTKERPKVLMELQDQQAREGESVVLECEVKGVPLPRITWFTGKKEIKESKFFKMTYVNNVARLVIAEVYPEDEGEYVCRAFNEAGMVQSSCDISIVESGAACIDDYPRDQVTTTVATGVTEPPFIEDLQPDVVHLLRGTYFQLKGKFQGEPRPEVRWYRDKTELRTGGALKIDVVRDTTTLTVTSAEVEDTGRYTLVVENELGVDRCCSSVTVEDRPNPPAGQPAATNITRNSLTLSWYGPAYDGGSIVNRYKVEMRIAAELDWVDVVTDCKDTFYHVTNLEPNTEYLFRVCAGNKHGFSDPGKQSEIIVTTERRRSITRDDHDELPFTPRVVTIQPNRTFTDHYTLREEIGRGRFGNVYKCSSKDTNREFAAKFIRVKPSEREETKLEISVMNELHHPKLLMLWDAFESPREMVLVMEHVAGGELFERIIDDDYILTERECVHFMRQICDGVHYMHGRNILHLDLKPENILCITPNSNEVKIIDFGLARKFDPKKTFKVMFGTPEFVAPEVVNYDHVTYSTDMWSVGVICYILLSGLSPFLGENEAETLVNVTMAQWDFDDEDFDEISEHAKNFIEGLLAKDKRKRMTSQECLNHKWLSQDVKYMRAKRLSTEKHKRFLARRKWQKTGNAIRALGRMAMFQKSLTNLGRSSSNDSLLSSRGSRATPSEPTTPPPSERIHGLRSHIKVTSEGTAAAGEHDSGIEKDSAASSDDGKSASDLLEIPTGKCSPDSGVQDTGEDIGHQGVPLKFQQKLQGIVVNAGENAHFEVVVVGDSKATEVRWFRDGEEVEKTRRIVMEMDTETGQFSLYIKKCRPDDAGAYKCMVDSSSVTISCSAELKVRNAATSS